ncbi:MAG: SpoIID/LytB domain-containing protein [Patescibacteria group bacterium]|nr:SpoIID/LytB domain-containing protein [Patescibacteria group bacterium]
MINKKNTKKVSHKKILTIALAVAVVFSSGFFFGQNTAEAKKKSKSKVTKWQSMLERNGVDRALWEKYLPKVSRKEYKKAVKALKKQGSVSGSGSLGPDMKVGLFKLNTENHKTITTNNNTGFRIKDKGGNVLREIAGGQNVALRAVTSGDYFNIRGGDGEFSTLTTGDYLILEPLDSNGVFEIADCEVNSSADKKSNPFGCYKTGSVKYDEFRGKLELSFNDDGTPWVINVLPMEQYTWGTGEIGDSKSEYYKLFSIIFRTYGYYHNEKRTKHADEEFVLTDTSSDQIYKGYKIEERFPKMRQATEETRGKIVAYKGKTALTPYCSYTDGETKDYPGDDYPYLKSVKDHKEGIQDNPGPGNHMYGLSAHGAVGWVKDGKSYEWVLKYYYTGVDIEGAY